MTASLIAAIRAVLDWIGRADDSAVVMFERIYEMYLRDTGRMRPGKDDVLSDTSSAENRKLFDQWCKTKSVEVRKNLESALTAYEAEVRERREKSPWKGPFADFEVDDWFHVSGVDGNTVYRTRDDAKAECIAAALNAHFGYTPDGTDMLSGEGK